jgi:hypothetical protein
MAETTYMPAEAVGVEAYHTGLKHEEKLAAQQLLINDLLKRVTALERALGHAHDKSPAILDFGGFTYRK